MDKGCKRELIEIAEGLDYTALLQRRSIYIHPQFMPREELAIYTSFDVKAMAFYSYWCSCVPFGHLGFYDFSKFIKLIAREEKSGLALAGDWGENIADILMKGDYALSYKGWEYSGGKKVRGLTFNQFLHPETLV